MIRVFVADDHQIVLGGIVRLLAEFDDIHVVGTATTGRGVIAAIETGEPRWDVLVLDLSLPRVGGFEVLRRALEARSDARVIILSMYPEEQHAEALLAAGAAAYVSKSRPPEELVEEVRRVASGHTSRARPVADVRKESAPHLRLSTREHQVFLLLIEGRSVAEIAAELDVLSSTVSNHIARIREKLHVGSIADIVRYAHRQGLVG